MSKLVARGVKSDDVQPYRPVESNGDAAARHNEAPARCHDFEYDSLDAWEIAPWLLLQCAQDRAGEILAEAARQAEEIRSQAMRECASAGREAAMKELLPSLVAFADAGQSLIVFEEQLIARSAPQLVTLALEIAEKVVGKAVEADAQIVASVLERAKQEVPDAKRIRVWLHPEDYRLLCELRADLIKVGKEGGRTIEVLTSEEIMRGGCRLESESGLVDATFPTQLEEIRRQLLDAEP